VPVVPAVAKKEPGSANWDDDDDSDDEPKHFVPSSKPKEESAKPKASVRSKKELLKKTKPTEETAHMSEGDRKEHMQKLVEDSDYALTEEMFGVQASGSAANPVNKEEHEALGGILGKKLGKQVESYHFGHMMKTMLKDALLDAKSDQIKELTSALNIMLSERQKAEKAKEGGKKKSAKGKKSLTRDHENVADEYDIGLTTQGNGYAAGFDDGDFM